MTIKRDLNKLTRVPLDGPKKRGYTSPPPAPKITTVQQTTQPPKTGGGK